MKIVAMMLLATLGCLQVCQFKNIGDYGRKLSVSEESERSGGNWYACSFIQVQCVTQVQVGASCTPGTPDSPACATSKNSAACNPGWANNCVGDTVSQCPAGVVAKCVLDCPSCAQHDKLQ